MAAAVESPPVHSTAQAGTSVAAQVTLRCQDLGNIVHLEHINLEVCIAYLHFMTTHMRTDDAQPVKLITM